MKDYVVAEREAQRFKNRSEPRGPTSAAPRICPRYLYDAGHRRGAERACNCVIENERQAGEVWRSAPVQLEEGGALEGVFQAGISVSRAYAYCAGYSW